MFYLQLWPLSLNSDDRDVAKGDWLQDKVLKPFILRRLKAEVERGIPDKKELTVYCKMTRSQKVTYQAVLKNNVEVLNARKGERTKLLNIVMQLRKACNHPYLFDGVEPPAVETPKALPSNVVALARASRLRLRAKARMRTTARSTEHPVRGRCTSLMLYIARTPMRLRGVRVGIVEIDALAGDHLVPTRRAVRSRARGKMR